MSECLAATNLLGWISFADIDKETSRSICIGRFFSTTTCLSVTIEIRKGRRMTETISIQDMMIYVYRIFCFICDKGTRNFGFLLKKNNTPQSAISNKLIRIPYEEISI